ncbi:VanZ family protein, partial [Ruminococcus sp.]
EPTAAQLDHLNLVLRKMAHVFLYAVFGGMLAVFWQLLLRHKVWRILGAIGCSTAIAFLDELQKIPIAGRHFDASESMLNAVSAAVVILIYFGIVRCVSRWRQNRQAAKIQ